MDCAFDEGTAKTRKSTDFFFLFIAGKNAWFWSFLCFLKNLFIIIIIFLGKLLEVVKMQLHEIVLQIVFHSDICWHMRPFSCARV